MVLCANSHAADILIGSAVNAEQVALFFYIGAPIFGSEFRADNGRSMVHGAECYVVDESPIFKV
jgi:hypothetical protein